MSNYTRKPNLDDFMNWLEDNKEGQAKTFYEDVILPAILDLESDDYFGTEGFDKRFG